MAKIKEKVLLITGSNSHEYGPSCKRFSRKIPRTKHEKSHDYTCTISLDKVTRFPVPDHYTFSRVSYALPVYGSPLKRQFSRWFFWKRHRCKEILSGRVATWNSGERWKSWRANLTRSKRFGIGRLEKATRSFAKAAEHNAPFTFSSKRSLSDRSTEQERPRTHRIHWTTVLHRSPWISFRSPLAEDRARTLNREISRGWSIDIPRVSATFFSPFLATAATAATARKVRIVPWADALGSPGP